MPAAIPIQSTWGLITIGLGYLIFGAMSTALFFFLDYTDADKDVNYSEDHAEYWLGLPVCRSFLAQKYIKLIKNICKIYAHFHHFHLRLSHASSTKSTVFISNFFCQLPLIQFFASFPSSYPSKQAFLKYTQET